jgi:hypothetical protein
MKRNTSILKTLLVTLPSLGLFLAPNSVWAGSRIYDGQDTCTGINCGAVFINGTPQRNSNGDSDPFTIQVHSDGNQCMRLDVTGQNDDMAIVLISPNGRVWANDDFNGTRPLIKAITNVDGFYTVQINRFNGLQPVYNTQGFTLAYGLYNNGNPNCSSPTAPIFNGYSPK